MSAIYLNSQLVHYEVFGRGQPILFLHSWLGSWRYWVPTMDQVSDRCRAYALDFWGFGESEHNTTEVTLSDLTQQVILFAEQLGIGRMTLVGHGLGGMVALQAAQAQPQRFTRVVAVATPLQGAILEPLSRKTSGLSKLMGKGSTTEAWTKLARQLSIEDSTIQQEVLEDTERVTEAVAQTVQDSMLKADLFPLLQRLPDTPLLAVYGEKDNVVPADHAAILQHDSGRPHQLIVLPKANHFMFLEHDTVFSRLIVDFLKSEGSPVEIKEQWRRRVSQLDYL